MAAAHDCLARRRDLRNELAPNTGSHGRESTQPSVVAAPNALGALPFRCGGFAGESGGETQLCPPESRTLRPLLPVSTYRSASAHQGFSEVSAGSNYLILCSGWRNNHRLCHNAIASGAGCKVSDHRIVAARACPNES